MAFYKLENNNLIEAPNNKQLEDGSSISNFNLVADKHGYKELISETKPIYDNRYQRLRATYEEFETHIVEKFVVEETKTVDELKAERIAYFNDNCNKVILDGFIAFNGHHYIFDYEAQGNFVQKWIMIKDDPTVTTVLWKTEDAGLVQTTKDEFYQIIKDAQLHKESTIQRYWNVKTRILDPLVTTHQQVLEIIW